MRVKAILAVLCIFALLLASCEDDAFSPPVYGGPGGGRDGGRFYAQNMTNDNFYTLYAEKLWGEEDDENTLIEVWAENGSGMTKADGKKVAMAYEDGTGSVYTKLMGVFGTQKDFTDVFTNNPAIVANDTMEFADFYGNGDKKLCVLLLKIKDGYNPPKNRSYVAGYFTPYNFLAYEPGYYDSYYSNECDMIYLDVKVNGPDTQELKTTLAHEMQHMMNFVTTLDMRPSGNTFKQMDLWIDEGLSSAAEYVYSGSPNNERIDWFNDDPTGRIALGNNFYVWGNYTKAIPNAILDDYATVYLFFQWLRIQAGGGNAIYTDIITSTASDFNAVLDAAKTRISKPTYNYSDPLIGGWRYLLRNWMAANYINAASGHYGYNGYITKLVNTRFYGNPSGNYKIDLFPGEGIYLLASAWPKPADPIKYADLTSGIPQDSGSSPPAHLLCYNTSTAVKGQSSEVTVALDTSSVSMVGTRQILQNNAVASGSRSLMEPVKPIDIEPYAISAGDMLRINGQKDDVSDLVISKLRSGKRIHD